MDNFPLIKVLRNPRKWIMPMKEWHPSLSRDTWCKRELRQGIISIKGSLSSKGSSHASFNTKGTNTIFNSRNGSSKSHGEWKSTSTIFWDKTKTNLTGYKVRIAGYFAIKNISWKNFHKSRERCFGSGTALRRWKWEFLMEKSSLDWVILFCSSWTKLDKRAEIWGENLSAMKGTYKMKEKNILREINIMETRDKLNHLCRRMGVKKLKIIGLIPLKTNNLQAKKDNNRGNFTKICHWAWEVKSMSLIMLNFLSHLKKEKS